MSFRLKNGVISLVYMILCILFLSIARFQGFILYGTIIFMMLVYYFLVYWLFNFDVYFQGFITVLLLPSVLFGSYLLVYYNFIKELEIAYQIAFTSVFIALQYYLILTQNLLNRSHFTNVSLSQAALIVNNFYSIFGFFLTCLAVFLIPDLSNILKIVLSIGIFAIFFFIFVLVNSIDMVQYGFGVFLFTIISFVLVMLYLFGITDSSNVLLFVLIMTVVFRGVTVISLYSYRKVVVIGDIIQIIIEAGLIGFIAYLSLL